VGSLSAHLRELEQHGRLAFHPGCPICRNERLVGTVPTEGLIPRRAQALIAAGVLVASTAAPATALAGAPDQEQDGTAAPQTSGGDPATSPNFDPGGDSTDLPFDASPPPEAQAPPDPGNPDTAPLDQEPGTDPGAPVADPGDGSQGPADGQPAGTPGQAPAAVQPGGSARPPTPAATGAPPVTSPQTLNRRRRPSGRGWAAPARKDHPPSSRSARQPPSSKSRAGPSAQRGRRAEPIRSGSRVKGPADSNCICDCHSARATRQAG
jgi:hypothetical protein